MSVRRGPRVLVLLACLGAGAAYAASGGSDASVDFRKSVTLTPAETAAQTKEYFKRMQDAEKHILVMQARAKRDKDMVKLNCVGDKLSQVRGHISVANTSVKLITGGVNDDGARQHEFTRMTILFQKVSTLDQEAQQCIGEDVSYVGATQNSMEVDPSVPPGDPTVPDMPLPEPTRPPEASPFV